MADEKLLHILQHSLGLNRHGEGVSYRNHFVTGAGSTDYPHCMALVAAGMMTRTPGNAITGGDNLFRVTPAGVDHVRQNSPPAPPKPKITRGQRRYEAFLDADCGMRFGEWLKTPWSKHA